MGMRGATGSSACRAACEQQLQNLRLQDVGTMSYRVCARLSTGASAFAGDVLQVACRPWTRTCNQLRACLAKLWRSPAAGNIRKSSLMRFGKAVPQPAQKRVTSWLSGEAGNSSSKSQCRAVRATARIAQLTPQHQPRLHQSNHPAQTAGTSMSLAASGCPQRLSQPPLMHRGWSRTPPTPAPRRTALCPRRRPAPAARVGLRHFSG